MFKNVEDAIQQLDDMAVNEYPDDRAAVEFVRNEVIRLQTRIDQLEDQLDYLGSSSALD
jgi:hypothetical protein